MVSGRKREADEVLSHMLATNAACPSVWFRNTDVQPVLSEERFERESGADEQLEADGEKVRLVRRNGASQQQPLETIELETQVWDGVVAERGHLGDIFAPPYRCVHCSVIHCV